MKILENSIMYNPYNDAEITDIAPTQTTNCGSWDSSATVLIGGAEDMNEIKNFLEPLNPMPDGTCRTIKSQYQNSSRANFERQPTFGATGVQSGVRIRKLTPKECWRLMDFDDSDFEKAEKVCSSSQLYKQAGNSIVCKCLEFIFREML